MKLIGLVARYYLSDNSSADKPKNNTPFSFLFFLPNSLDEMPQNLACMPV
jgi:hypothetical protein